MISIIKADGTSEVRQLEAMRARAAQKNADIELAVSAVMLKGTPGHVNLIPLNDVEESPLKPSRRVAAFQRRLEGHGVTVTVRRKLGGDIDASCGQLRRKAMAQTLGRNDGRKEADIP